MTVPPAIHSVQEALDSWAARKEKVQSYMEHENEHDGTVKHVELKGSRLTSPECRLESRAIHKCKCAYSHQ